MICGRFQVVGGMLEVAGGRHGNYQKVYTGEVFEVQILPKNLNERMIATK